MEENKEYPTFEIVTIDDLMKTVTAENIDDLFNDLKATAIAFIEQRETHPVLGLCQMNKWVWVDDGKREITFEIDIPDDEE